MEIIIWILAFTIAITIHEAAHAWMADRLGDPTPRLMGRLSLNPIVHYDPIGTTLLLVLVIMRSLGAPVIPFGWAKPVQFDPYNLKNPRRDSALISLAGPASNLLLAIAASILLYILPATLFSLFLAPIIVLNVVLAVFNLVPIHPLDGGKIFIGLLPADQADEADSFLRRYGMLILFALIFPWGSGQSPLFTVLSPIIDFILSILLPGSAFI
jgi:Zn-dependent protease